MNHLQNFAEFTTVEDGKEQLKKAVAVRDEMGGAMYYNMLNDDCCEIAQKLKNMGGDHEEISGILGKGTHTFNG